jgi:hypothetical protein
MEPRAAAARFPTPASKSDTKVFRRPVTMRTSRTQLVGAVLGGLLLGIAPGCGGTNELEKPPPGVMDQKPDMNKMPGFNEMQEKLKAEKKIK